VRANIGGVSIAAALLLAVPASNVEITSCDQVLRDGEVGELRQDLNCAQRPRWPFSAQGVRVEGGATLNLNGFTIRGDGTGVGIYCAPEGEQNVCTVNGPGTITGFWAGFNGVGCRFVVRRLFLHGNTNGIFGPLACDLRARDLRVVRNGESGIWVSGVRARRLVVSRNRGYGLVARSVDVRSLAARGNGLEGLLQWSTRGRFGRITRSRVTGNDTAGAGFDIAAAGTLTLRRVRCGRSAVLRYPRIVDSTDDEPAVVGSLGCRHD
jgi:hypothetical protein